MMMDAVVFLVMIASIFGVGFIHGFQAGRGK